MGSYDFEAANDASLFFGLGDWYFLTDHEKQKRHEDILNLPSFAKESADAKERIKERIKDRIKRRNDPENRTKQASKESSQRGRSC